MSFIRLLQAIRSPMDTSAAGSTVPTVESIKAAFRTFVRGRPKVPRQQLEAELGDILLYIVREADELGIDLAAAGEAQIARRRDASRHPESVTGAFGAARDGKRETKQ